MGAKKCAIDKKIAEQILERQHRAFQIMANTVHSKEKLALSKAFRTWSRLCADMKAAEKHAQQLLERQHRALNIVTNSVHSKERMLMSKAFQTWNRACVKMRAVEAENL